jgi:hypothetical protein
LITAPARASRGIMVLKKSSRVKNIIPGHWW